MFWVRRQFIHKERLVEHTAEHNPREAESNSSTDSAESYENSTTMSGNQSQTQSPEQPTAGVTHKEETHMEDFATALECYRSSEYAKAIDIRRGKAVMDIVVTEGYDGPQPTD